MNKGEVTNSQLWIAVNRLVDIVDEQAERIDSLEINLATLVRLLKNNG